MNILRKKILTLPLSLFFLLLYAGVYLSSGYWHTHHKSSDEKSLSLSKEERCDYCKLVTSETFDVCNNDIIFHKNAIIHFSLLATEKVFFSSVLNHHNKAPPVKA